MPITSISSDPETLTLTVVGDYSVSVERLWEAWADPPANSSNSGDPRPGRRPSNTMI